MAFIVFYACCIILITVVLVLSALSIGIVLVIPWIGSIVLAIASVVVICCIVIVTAVAVVATIRCGVVPICVSLRNSFSWLCSIVTIVNIVVSFVIILVVSICSIIVMDFRLGTASRIKIEATIGRSSRVVTPSNGSVSMLRIVLCWL